MCDVIDLVYCVFFFKQKTAYEMRISDWSSDVCSSDLPATAGIAAIQDNLFDPPFLLPPLLGERQRILEFLENDLDNALQFALLLRGEMVQEIGRASCRERVCQYV